MMLQVCKTNAPNLLATAAKFTSGARMASSIQVCAILLYEQIITNIILISVVITQAQNLRRNLSTAIASRAAAATAQGHHAKLWTVERALSAGLLVALPATVLFPSQPLDLIVAVTTVMHAHWGLEAIVVDYVRPVLVGNVVPKVAHVLLILFSAATLAGLVYFIQNDIGIGQAVQNVWAIKPYVEPIPEPAPVVKGKK